MIGYTCFTASGTLQQVDAEPPIRANTTILLGNLAAHLGEATQKRVLLNAFTRALKDGFPPARVAGLKVWVYEAADRCGSMLFGPLFQRILTGKLRELVAPALSPPLMRQRPCSRAEQAIKSPAFIDTHLDLRSFSVRVLQAVVATAELHAATEVAQRILPAIAPLAADPIEDVRSHALAALHCFVKQLRCTCVNCCCSVYMCCQDMHI